MQPSSNRPSSSRPTSGFPSSMRPSSTKPSTRLPSSSCPTSKAPSGRPSSSGPTSLRPSAVPSSNSPSSIPSASRPSSHPTSTKPSSFPSSSYPSSMKPSGRPVKLTVNWDLTFIIQDVMKSSLNANILVANFTTIVSKSLSNTTMIVEALRKSNSQAFNSVQGVTSSTISRSQSNTLFVKSAYPTGQPTSSPSDIFSNLKLSHVIQQGPSTPSQFYWMIGFVLAVFFSLPLVIYGYRLRGEKAKKEMRIKIQKMRFEANKARLGAFRIQRREHMRWAFRKKFGRDINVYADCIESFDVKSETQFRLDQPLSTLPVISYGPKPRDVSVISGRVPVPGKLFSKLSSLAVADEKFHNELLEDLYDSTSNFELLQRKKILPKTLKTSSLIDGAVASPLKVTINTINGNDTFDANKNRECSNIRSSSFDTKLRNKIRGTASTDISKRDLELYSNL